MNDKKYLNFDAWWNETIDFGDGRILRRKNYFVEKYGKDIEFEFQTIWIFGRISITGETYSQAMKIEFSLKDELETTLTDDETSLAADLYFAMDMDEDHAGCIFSDEKSSKNAQISFIKTKRNWETFKNIMALLGKKIPNESKLIDHIYTKNQ